VTKHLDKAVVCVDNNDVTLTLIQDSRCFGCFNKKISHLHLIHSIARQKFFDWWAQKYLSFCHKII